MFFIVNPRDCKFPVVSIRFAFALIAPELIVPLVIFPQLRVLLLVWIVVQTNAPIFEIDATSTLDVFFIVNPRDWRLPVKVYIFPLLVYIL